jgi:hypothetical protein
MMNIPPRPRRPRAGHRVGAAFVLGLAMVGAGVSSPGGHGGISAQSAQTLNPCALLKVEEIEPLGGKATVSEGVPGSLEAFGSVSCRYAWGVGVNRLQLEVILNEAARMFPGMSPFQIRQHLLDVGRFGAIGEAVSDVGDAAVFTSDSHLIASAIATSKGHILEVRLDGIEARESKDELIELLKTAVSRLP